MLNKMRGRARAVAHVVAHLTAHLVAHVGEGVEGMSGPLWAVSYRGRKDRFVPRAESVAVT
jgi:hypothetical protein